jgi:hypothetical protein
MRKFDNEVVVGVACTLSLEDDEPKEPKESRLLPQFPQFLGSVTLWWVRGAAICVQFTSFTLNTSSSFISSL